MWQRAAVLGVCLLAGGVIVAAPEDAPPGGGVPTFGDLTVAAGEADSYLRPCKACKGRAYRRQGNAKVSCENCGGIGKTIQGRDRARGREGDSSTADAFAQAVGRWFGLALEYQYTPAGSDRRLELRRKAVEYRAALRAASTQVEPLARSYLSANTDATGKFIAFYGEVVSLSANDEGTEIAQLQIKPAVPLGDSILCLVRVPTGESWRTDNRVFVAGLVVDNVKYESIFGSVRTSYLIHPLPSK